MQRHPLNRHTAWDVWPAFDPGQWIDFNPTVVQLPGGRTIAIVRRDRFPPVPGRGSLWQVHVDAQLRPCGAPSLLVGRGEDPRAVVLGQRLLLFYCVIDRDAEDRVCGSTMVLAEFAIEGDALRAVGAFQLPKNPVGLARPGDRAAAWEKNWVPFAVSPTEVALIYTHEPWHVLVLDCDPAQAARRFTGHHSAAALQWRYGEVRGGTPPVDFSGPDSAELITFFHSSLVVGSRKVYVVGACTFERAAPHRPRRMTRDPLLIAPYRSGAHRFGWQFAGSVVFPLGAMECEAGYRLLCGRDDGEVASFLVDHAALAERLEPLEAIDRREQFALSDGAGQTLHSAGPLLLGAAAPSSWPLARLLEFLGGRGRGFIDWAAGDGVASLVLADGFARGVAVEADAAKRRALQRNLALNDLQTVQVVAPPPSLDAALETLIDLGAGGAIDLLRIDAPEQCAAVLRCARRLIELDGPLLLLRLGDDALVHTAITDALDAAGYDSQRLHAHHPGWCLALPRERRAAWA